jgi:prepilin-type N-terminal cleavage/methylation domain-containing protein
MSLKNRSPRLRGFTLVELVIVIVILGILASVAMPKFFDMSTDAKIATCKGDVSAMREAISQFQLKASLNDAPAWPTLAELRTSGTVMMSIPDNPFSTAVGGGGCAPTNLKNRILAGVTAGVPVSAGTSGGWCYKATTGEIWADSASGNGEAGF